ncbi:MULTISPECIES: hypothetical protein [Bacteria]|uniref:hypothetical protein n=1 Tax=Bacteria TaxID=2 RepID=UPI0005C16CD0|nr:MULTISPECIES: hypothetical protein [Bacteria]KIV34461.1 hypothetical protein TR09_17390 [Vibrio parahaemolyticus]MED3865398.1 hypothetical protein [Priestia megaterium]MED4219201.1 hypothetical protein [Priestia megaterium]
MDREQLEKAKEAIIALANRIKDFFRALAEKVKSITQSLNRYVSEYKVYKTNKQKLLRQSWSIKQDTRRASQVMNNRPRINIRKIIY